MQKELEIPLPMSRKPARIWRILHWLPLDTIRMALDTVRSNKFRSFLTVLGIVIGVTVVIAVASILTGMRRSIINMVEEYGTNNIYAFHLSTGPQVGDRDRAEYYRKPLTPEDADAIRAQADAVEAVANAGFLWMVDRTIKYNGVSYKQGDLQGVSSQYERVANISLTEGRFISPVDDEHRRNVMVVGVNAAEALFPHQSTIAGRTVAWLGKEFEVIGVLEKRKSGFFGENEEDNAVFVPFETARKLAPRSEWMMMNIRAKSGRLADAYDQVEQILRRQRGLKFNEPNNFDLNTADRIVKQFDSITAAIGIFAIAISAVGLLVGGIGVMNIMLVSVTERTREIGVRKALGATRRDIVRQFLFEAMTLTFLGGLLGVLLAIGVSYILMWAVPAIPATIPLWAVGTGVSVSILVGLIFGVWPARKASRLDPIECLRYE
ncbi:MAG: ABC transporter permease [Acidobacteria bacterium]|nr:ABC transporter permease [Acidobacteriota bacterium]MBI3426841.1 ABC transporter permease [Acidobacteriota bacterium]